MVRLTMLLVFVLFFAFAVQVNATDRWSKQDIVLESVWQGFHLIDWLQTRQIADNPYRYYELNPVLGSHPSKRFVNIYMLSGAILHPVITDFLPKKYRPYFQGITIASSGACIAHNFSIGLGIKW